MAHVILMEEIEEGASLKYLEVDDNHLMLTAQLAKDQGFDLMFEFDSQPDMEDAIRRLGKIDDGISKMPNMVKLWVLDETRI